jgi:NADPH:quinone reductase-like Zn-dependent oxidoreductase
MMRSIQFEEYGGPEVLKLVEIPIPQPGEGQVLIKVRFAGVNPADWKMRSGFMKAYRPVPMPWTPGLEGAGMVETLGSGVTQFQQGQAVYGAFPGAYAEYAVSPVSELQPKPEKLSFEEAASVPIGSLTAWGSLFEVANLQPGQRVLVQGAAGGVGLYGVQLALWKGAEVYGTASTANVDFVRSLGAEAIDYTRGPVEQKVRDLDLVFDTVGGEVIQQSLKLLKRGGLLVTVAGQVNEEAAKAMGVRAVRGKRALTVHLAEISRLIEEDKLKPEVYKVFPLKEARQAQELSETGHGRGRIVLRV